MTGLDRLILGYIKDHPQCNVKDLHQAFGDRVAFTKKNYDGQFLWFTRVVGKLAARGLVDRWYVGNGVRLSLTQKARSLV